MIVIVKENENWLRFSEPQEVFKTACLDEVIPLLDRAVKENCYVAGWLSYEAAAAFDEAMITGPVGDVPLMVIGLFDSVERLTVLPETLGEGSVSGLEASVNEATFESAIDSIKKQIAAGATYQVNYSYRLEGAFTGDTYGFFRSFVTGQDAGYAAYVELDNWAVCSASPELFFRLKEGVLESRPMKGTVRRGRTPLEDAVLANGLRSSEKNRAENIMIVDMIRNDLGRVAETGSVETVETFTLERYPTVWQMTSTVRGLVKGSVLDVLRALFPCASITGAPKVKTMELIKSLETNPRGVYTGSVGYWGPNGDAQFNVAIRTAVIDAARGRLTYGVGGGIVWDSDAASEYAETLAKAEVLQGERPDFDLLETVLWTPKAGVYLLERHVERFVASAEFFGRSVDQDELTRLLDLLEGSYPLRVRLLLDERCSLRIEQMPLQALNKGGPLRVRLASEPVDRGDRWLYHKTTHRAVYEAAEAERVDCEEVILWNQEGEITEGTIFNIAVERQGKWVTPPVTSGLLGGVMRAELLASGELFEGIVLVEELREAGCLRLFNSVRGVCDAVLK
ncbi:MAG: aminodeoxychorismate synthase component I [Pontiellaceae bacterium]